VPHPGEGHGDGRVLHVLVVLAGLKIGLLHTSANIHIWVDDSVGDSRRGHACTHTHAYIHAYQGRGAGGRVRHDLVALVHEPLVVDLLEHPPGVRECVCTCVWIDDIYTWHVCNHCTRTHHTLSMKGVSMVL
jgi:hypothetical protein